MGLILPLIILFILAGYIGKVRERQENERQKQIIIDAINESKKGE